MSRYIMNYRISLRRYRFDLSDCLHRLHLYLIVSIKSKDVFFLFLFIMDTLENATLSPSEMDETKRISQNRVKHAQKASVIYMKALRPITFVVSITLHFITVSYRNQFKNMYVGIYLIYF